MRNVSAKWYYGASRLGKSWKAIINENIDPLKNMKAIYFKNSQNKWFDGYNGEDIVFIDELPIEQAKWNLNYMKQWTDKLPLLPE